MLNKVKLVKIDTYLVLLYNGMYVSYDLCLITYTMVLRRQIFEGVLERRQLGGLCQVALQYVELYNEELQDLLLQQTGGYNRASVSSSNGGGVSGRQQVSIRESPGGEIFLEGAREVTVTSAAHMLEIIALGNESR